MTDAAPSPETAASASGEPETIRGERRAASMNSVRSTQSRVSNALAMVVFGGLTLAGMFAYYSSIPSRAADTEKIVQQRSESEMSLPAIGVVSTPPMPRPDAPMPTDRIPSPLGRSHKAEKTALERQLSGPVMIHSTSRTANREDAPGDRVGVKFSAGASLDRESEGPSEIGPWLKSTALESARAHRLTDQQLLLAKGTTLDCTLLSAIDSTLPGFTTCVTATDTWSADGSVVLLERGSRLFGETRGQVQEGKSRLFILWSEARTPNGIVVPLASPGTDPLGRSGVTGTIDRHFGSRFGAAILVSIIDGVVQRAAASQNSDSVVINPSSSRDVLTEILRETMKVRPTLRKRQGDRVTVLVARDLDFRGVYALAEK